MFDNCDENDRLVILKAAEEAARQECAGRNPSQTRLNSGSGKTGINYLTRLAIIDSRLPIRTALAEQGQHYSSPAVSP